MDTDLLPPESHCSDSVSPALGVRLKALREAFGLSQRELAKRAGVTNSNISMIEQDQISPSVQSLNKILNAFPVSLTEFFSASFMSSLSPVIRAQHIPRFSSPEGVLVSELIQQGLTGEILMSRISIPVGIADKMKSADQDIAGWVLSGELDLHLANQVFKLEKSDGFYIKREQIYQLVNSQSDILELVVASVSPNS